MRTKILAGFLMVSWAINALAQSLTVAERDRVIAYFQELSAEFNNATWTFQAVERLEERGRTTVLVCGRVLTEQSERSRSAPLRFTASLLPDGSIEGLLVDDSVRGRLC